MLINGLGALAETQLKVRFFFRSLRRGLGSNLSPWLFETHSFCWGGMLVLDPPLKIVLDNSIRIGHNQNPLLRKGHPKLLVGFRDESGLPTQHRDRYSASKGNAEVDVTALTIIGTCGAKHHIVTSLKRVGERATT
jgi:hypothetical protein